MKLLLCAAIVAGLALVAAYCAVDRCVREQFDEMDWGDY